ncbi:MAG TPA: signal peptidase I [Gemmatimonadales bacterium]|nr:signal peptidase I [Gemmatimonadales bacterium]
MVALATLALGLVWTRGGTRWPAIYYMTGPSMAPAVGAGAWFLAAIPGGPVHRGDLVLVELTLEDTSYDVLRRVVGLPGDTLTMLAGRLSVNGGPAPWPFRVLEDRAERPLDGPVAGTIYRWGPVVVGPDSLFLLSDTRDMIGWPDSRFLGALPRPSVVGKFRRLLWRGPP